MSSIRLTSVIAIVLAFLVITITIENVHANQPADSTLIFTVAQADGTTFQARAWGDHFSGGFETVPTKTVPGYSIIFDGDSKNWMYAIHNADGRLVASNNIVGKDSPPEGVKPFLRPIKSQIANRNPTFQDRMLRIPFVDSPQKGAKYQDVTFELTEEGEWQLLSFLTIPELQYIDRVEVIKTESFPIQVFLKVIGDFPARRCQKVGQISYKLLGRRFDIWAYSEKLACAEGFTFTHLIPLPVYSLKKGEYAYTVNGRYTGTFYLTEDNTIVP